MIAISVISGKGGTGKTMFSATLAQMLVKTKRFEDPARTNVLLVDLDLHVRGLSLLMHIDYRKLNSANVTSHRILEDNEDNYKVDKLTLLIKSAELKITENIYLLPSTNLTQPVIWPAVHEKEVIDFIPRLNNIVEAAKNADFDVVIFDTRAGPDNISLSVALTTDLTFILLEQDEVNGNIAFKLRGELLTLGDRIAQKLSEPPKSGFYFIHNKTLTPYSRETQRVLGDLTFLPAIPFDIKFLKQYYYFGRKYIVSGKQIYTRFGFSVDRVLNSALDKIAVPYSTVQAEDDKLSMVKEDNDIVKFIRSIPPQLMTIIAITALFISGAGIIVPLIIGEQLSKFSFWIGVLFVVFNLYLLFLRGSQKDIDIIRIEEEINNIVEEEKVDEGQEQPSPNTE